MKLDYFTLISPDPLHIHGVGDIKSPTLSEISKLESKINTYNYYVTILLLNIGSYYEEFEKEEGMFFYYPNDLKNKMLKLRDEYASMNNKQKEKITFYNFLMNDDILKFKVAEALNFFIVDKVEFSDKYNMFVTYNGDLDDDGNLKITGAIHAAIYDDVIDIIMQRINIENKRQEKKNLKIKNKIAEKLLEKMKKGESQKKKNDEKTSIANIISSLSSHHQSLNIVNIWNLTVYQLYDQFSKTRINDTYKISSRSISIWGDKDKKFDDMLWMTMCNKN